VEKSKKYLDFLFQTGYIVSWFGGKSSAVVTPAIGAHNVYERSHCPDCYPPPLCWRDRRLALLSPPPREQPRPLRATIWGPRRQTDDAKDRPVLPAKRKDFNPATPERCQTPRQTNSADNGSLTKLCVSTHARKKWVLALEY